MLHFPQEEELNPACEPCTLVAAPAVFSDSTPASTAATHSSRATLRKCFIVCPPDFALYAYPFGSGLIFPRPVRVLILTIVWQGEILQQFAPVEYSRTCLHFFLRIRYITAQKNRCHLRYTYVHWRFPTGL